MLISEKSHNKISKIIAFDVKSIFCRALGRSVGEGGSGGLYDTWTSEHPRVKGPART